MLMATRAELESSEVRMLEDVDAFREIGISRSEFFRVVDYYRLGPCHALPSRLWLTFEDGHVISAVLDKVRDPDSRLLLCRLAQLLIMADGQMTEIERQIYDRMLLRWGYTRSTVVEAILARRSDRNGRRKAAH
jgi:hypothetical protein